MDFLSGIPGDAFMSPSSQRKTVRAISGPAPGWGRGQEGGLVLAQPAFHGGPPPADPAADPHRRGQVLRVAAQHVADPARRQSQEGSQGGSVKQNKGGEITTSGRINRRQLPRRSEG